MVPPVSYKSDYRAKEVVNFKRIIKNEIINFVSLMFGQLIVKTPLRYTIYIPSVES